MSFRPLIRLIPGAAIWEAPVVRRTANSLFTRQICQRQKKRTASALSQHPSLGEKDERKGFAIRVDDYNATIRLAQLFAPQLLSSIAQNFSAGDLVMLYGSIGAGKSSFVRELIRSLLKEDDLVVPSPTYLLQQSYDYQTPDGHFLVIDHFDLYRLAGMEVGAFDRLQILESIPYGITFIEHANILPGNFIESNLISLEIKIDLDLSSQSQDVVVEADDVPRIFNFFASGEAWRDRLIQLQSVIENSQLPGLTRI